MAKIIKKFSWFLKWFFGCFSDILGNGIPWKLSENFEGTSKKFESEYFRVIPNSENILKKLSKIKQISKNFQF